VVARSWRPALVLAPLFGFVCGEFLMRNVVAGLVGAAAAFAVLVAIGGAATLVADDDGLTYTRPGRTRRIAWTDMTGIVCWVRQPWGGRVAPLRVEVTSSGQEPSPALALPLTLRIDLIRRATAERGAAAIEEWASRTGVPTEIRRDA
jgi:hypothetical protein